MKQLALTIGILALSTSAFADISSGNADLRGWAVDDQRLQNVDKRSYSEPVLPFGSDDQYGGILFNDAPATTSDAGTVGVGDSYGSILHNVGFSY